MERQRSFEHDRTRTSADSPADGDNLDQVREEVDGLLHASDRIFDSINHLHAQQYLEQNLQTGGE